ncbi:protein ALP1-like [Photinus pyralis]|nr:protein ALP1-like [Photinus pyralis]
MDTLPTTPAAWTEVAKIFETRWNLPHCVGAIDGKHVVLQAPVNSVDGNYNFMFADVGCQGRISDGGVFKASKLHRMLAENTLGLPLPEELPGRSMQIPYFFAGDSAFALSENLMKPYAGDFAKGTPQRIFNYRLSRGRRIVENAFGISSAVFRVLRRPMLLKPETAELVVMTTILLHNYLRTHSPNLYAPVGLLDNEMEGNLIEGSWRKEGDMTSMLPLINVPRRSTNYCSRIRDEIADYFIKEGFLEWQNQYA